MPVGGERPRPHLGRNEGGSAAKEPVNKEPAAKEPAAKGDER